MRGGTFTFGKFDTKPYIGFSMLVAPLQVVCKERCLDLDSCEFMGQLDRPPPACSTNNGVEDDTLLEHKENKVMMDGLCLLANNGVGHDALLVGLLFLGLVGWLAVVIGFSFLVSVFWLFRISCSGS